MAALPRQRGAQFAVLRRAFGGGVPGCGRSTAAAERWRGLRGGGVLGGAVEGEGREFGDGGERIWIRREVESKSGWKQSSGASAFGDGRLRDREDGGAQSPVGCSRASRVVHMSSVEASPSSTSASRSSSAASSEFVRGVEVSPTPPQGLTGGAVPWEEGQLQLENIRLIYSGMTSKELLSTLVNLQLMSMEPIVDLSIRVLKSPVMKLPLLSAPIFWAVRRTAYSHFVAGADAAEASATLTRMWELGLRGVLDYGLEDAEDEDSCDKNCAGFMDTILQTRSLPEGSVSFSCVKISAIGPISLLERVSDLLRWQHKHPDFKLPWKQDGMAVLAPESSTSHTTECPDALSPQEEKDLLKCQERLSQLCKAGAAQGLPMLVDAEYQSIQPAIDYITYLAAFEFNAGDLPIVYGTLQAYLKDAPSRLSLALSEASRRNSTLAVKIVRGAYITREKAFAASAKAPFPIHDNIRDTHRCYDSCVSAMLHRVASGKAAVMLATHNRDSGTFAAKRAMELGLDKKDPRLQFAQLKGMADGLSLALVQAGLNVSKYVPFGPVERVIPYLVRRAEENRGLLGNTSVERENIRKELGRRFMAAAGFNGASQGTT